MSITIQPVNASDLIDNGRTKFNANDFGISVGIDALTDQLAAHVPAGHPLLYYTKTEVDSILNGITNVTRFYFGYNVATNESLFCGIPGAFALIAGAGSITKIIITDTYGFKKELIFSPGTHPVAQGNKLSLIAGPDLFAGDELNPLTGGIALFVAGSSSYQITAFLTGVLGFPGYGNFTITVEEQLT